MYVGDNMYVVGNMLEAMRASSRCKFIDRNDPSYFSDHFCYLRVHVEVSTPQLQQRPRPPAHSERPLTTVHDASHTTPLLL
jgi:hypothetical protein